MSAPATTRPATSPATRAAAAAGVGPQRMARAEPPRAERRPWIGGGTLIAVAVVAACAYAAPHVTRYLEIREIARSGEDPLRVYCAASWPEASTSFARVTICEAVAQAERRPGGLAYEIGPAAARQ